MRFENVRVAHTRVYIWASEGAFEDFGVEKALLGRGSVSEHLLSQIFFIFRCRFGTLFGLLFETAFLQGASQKRVQKKVPFLCYFRVPGGRAQLRGSAVCVCSVARPSHLLKQVDEVKELEEVTSMKLIANYIHNTLTLLRRWAADLERATRGDRRPPLKLVVGVEWTKHT